MGNGKKKKTKLKYWADLEQREEKIEGRDASNRWAVPHKFVCKLVVWNRDEAMAVFSLVYRAYIAHRIALRWLSGWKDCVLCPNGLAL